MAKPKQMRPVLFFKAIINIGNMQAIEEVLRHLQMLGPLQRAQHILNRRSDLPEAIQNLVQTVDEYNELGVVHAIQDIAVFSSSGLVADN